MTVITLISCVCINYYYFKRISQYEISRVSIIFSIFHMPVHVISKSLLSSTNPSSNSLFIATSRLTLGSPPRSADCVYHVYVLWVLFFCFFATTLLNYLTFQSFDYDNI
jgi:hypothetical protein